MSKNFLALQLTFNINALLFKALLFKASLRVAIKGRSLLNNNIICSAICMAVKGHNNQWYSKLLIATLRSLLVTNFIFPDNIIPSFNSTQLGTVPFHWLFNIRSFSKIRCGGIELCVRCVIVTLLSILLSNQGFFGVLQTIKCSKQY